MPWRVNYKNLFRLWPCVGAFLNGENVLFWNMNYTRFGIAQMIHSLPYRTLSENYLRRKKSLKYIWLSPFSGLLRETHSPVQCDKSYTNSADLHQNKSKHICIRDYQSQSSNLQTKKSHFAFNASGQLDMIIRVPHRMSTHRGVWRILRQHELNGYGRYV